MKRVFYRFYFGLILILIKAQISMAQENRYHSDILVRMSDVLQMRATLDTLQNGVYVAWQTYKGKPLTVIVNDKEVEHIGYTIFSDEIRRAAPISVLNFLERYALELSLPLQGIKTVERRMFEDEVRFSVGGIEVLSELWEKKDLCFSLKSEHDRFYKATWTLYGNVLCSLSFPKSYNLLHGMDLVESQRRLAEELRLASSSVLGEEMHVDAQHLVKMFEPNCFLLKGDSIYLASLNNDTYYIKGEDNKFHLLFSEKHPLKSFSNLLTTNSIENDIQAMIKLVLYDFKNEIIRVPLVNMLNYFRNKGCRAYFGVIQSDKQYHTAELLLLNEQEGYCHVIKLAFNTSHVSSRAGIISGRMNCYVPVPKIKFLFKEKQR